MRLKLFRAATIAAAMAQVRAELGPDALILSSRRAGAGVEVTAALEPDAAPQAEPHPARLAALQWHGVPPTLAQGLISGPFDQALARALRFGALAFGPGSAPVLLAGAPGAGKTLTAVRLATRLVLAGATPLVISTDDERAGATEQLQAFTRLLGITLVLAPDAVTLARALARRSPDAPVLIDTAGIDPFCPKSQAATALLAATAAAQIALVLPAGLDVSEAADTAAAFTAAGATALVATRLDVARRLGGVLAAGAAGLVLTEAGIGPGAADGLAPLTPALLAQRLTAPGRRAA